MRLLKDRKILLVSYDTSDDRREFHISNTKRAMLKELLDFSPEVQYKTITFKVGTLNNEELEAELLSIYSCLCNCYLYNGRIVTRDCAEKLIRQSYITVEMTVEVDDETQLR